MSEVVMNDGGKLLCRYDAEGLRHETEENGRCPVCKKIMHIYMHVYDDKTSRGGLWIWCSECYTFSHGSIYVPEYWGNCPLVESEKLCAIPAYLDEIR